MENKHTALPWRIETDYRVESLYDPTYLKIKGSHLIAKLRLHGDKELDDEQQANAHLIAAAPELLEACEKIVNNWGNLHPKDRQQLRRAISKAKGSE